MAKSIFVRLKEKLEQSLAEKPVKDFIQYIVMLEDQLAEHEKARYREDYEKAIEKYLDSFEVEG